MQTLYLILAFLLDAYSWILIIYVLMTWLPGAMQSRFGQVIVALVRPYLDIFDQIIPSIGGLSFSALIGLLVLNLAKRGLLAIFMLLS